MFFCIQDLSINEKVTVMFQKNTTKVTLLVSFELVGAHSHSTYANMSNILTPPIPRASSPLKRTRTFYRPPFPFPSILQNFPELLKTTEQVNVCTSLF